MKRMAMTCLILVGLAGSLQAADQSIAEYYSITNISNITITFAPKGYFAGPGTNSWSVSDLAFLNKTRDLLHGLPSAGVLYKSWPDDLPMWRVGISDGNKSLANLTIWGTRLEAPVRNNGGFYSETGGKEKEFVEHIQSVARK